MVARVAEAIMVVEEVKVVELVMVIMEVRVVGNNRSPKVQGPWCLIPRFGPRSLG